MKVISLYQPYATLMVMGLKLNETRGRNWKYRGPVLIHATAKMPGWCKDLLNKPFFNKDLHGIELPLGKILGQVEITDTHKTTEWVANQLAKKLTGDAFENFQREFVYGDYSEGRFAWETKNAKQFDEPIPAKGHQGVWFYDLPAKLLFTPKFAVDQAVWYWANWQRVEGKISEVDVRDNGIFYRIGTDLVPEEMVASK